MKKIFLFPSMLLVAIGAYFLARTYANKKPTNQPAKQALMEENYFFPNNFYPGIKKTAAAKNDKFGIKKIQAGIIPHDVTQSKMIADFFYRLATQESQPKIIFLLGPNHKELGSNKLITTTADWQTEFGIVKTDDYIINSLIKDNLAAKNRQIIANEHSVSAIAPYISYYLPKARVVPLIFKAGFKPQETGYLIKRLDKYLDNDSIMVAAVDFSHYLTVKQADKNDELTKRYLTDLDYRTVLNLGPHFNDYLDSPPAIGLLLEWLLKKGYHKSQIINHTNSAGPAKDENIPTTSYFEIIYF